MGQLAHRGQPGSDLQEKHVVLVEFLQALEDVVFEHRCVSDKTEHGEEDVLKLRPDSILVGVDTVGVLGHHGEHA